MAEKEGWTPAVPRFFSEERGWNWLQAAAVGPKSCVHPCSQVTGGSAFGHLWNHPQGRFSLRGHGSDGDEIQTRCVLAAFQRLGLG